MKTVWRYLTRKKPTTDPLDEIQKDIRALEIELALFKARRLERTAP